MNLDKAVGIVLTILAVPFLVKYTLWAGSAAMNPGDPEVMSGAAELVADAATPWWVPFVEFLSGIPGKVGAFLLLGFVGFVAWKGLWDK